MERIRVAAREGTRCPMEGKPRKYITDTPVEVPLTTYYRRRLDDGSLVPFRDVRKAAEKPAATSERKEASKK